MRVTPFSWRWKTRVERPSFSASGFDKTANSNTGSMSLRAGSPVALVPSGVRAGESGRPPSRRARSPDRRVRGDDRRPDRNVRQILRGGSGPRHADSGKSRVGLPHGTTTATTFLCSGMRARLSRADPYVQPPRMSCPIRQLYPVRARRRPVAVERRILTKSSSRAAQKARLPVAISQPHSFVASALSTRTWRRYGVMVLQTRYPTSRAILVEPLESERSPRGRASQEACACRPRPHMTEAGATWIGSRDSAI